MEESFNCLTSLFCFKYFIDILLFSNLRGKEIEDEDEDEEDEVVDDEEEDEKGAEKEIDFLQGDSK